MASNSSSQARDMVLFARGVIALLDSWDVLRLAITEGWGGPESSAKRTWLASIIVDEFESSTASNSPDLDYIADLILQAMSDEFDVDVDDGSAERIAESVVKLWAAEPTTAAQMVAQFQAAAEKRSKVKVQASRGEGNGDSDWESESEDEDGVPRLMESGAQPAAPREKPEPVVDEDGFTLVQGKGKGKH
ncbi:Pre-rRNA-processing protein TSR2 [Rhizoctonia solani]|uniref:Pre-rRNA-processing protein TSR2 n=1 Tax=Rhizoctonia solani TaxID=456999 RepID=A0A8H7HAX2_9AGAM|nr:Pre-rRNA-processing protein TSR2 [Rhizoctonia solani]